MLASSSILFKIIMMRGISTTNMLLGHQATVFFEGD